MKRRSILDARFARELAKRRRVDDEEIGELVQDGAAEIVYPFTNRSALAKREVGPKHAPRVEHAVAFDRDVYIHGQATRELVALQPDPLEAFNLLTHQRAAIERLRKSGVRVESVSGVHRVTFNEEGASERAVVDARIVQHCSLLERELRRSEPRLSVVAATAFRLGGLVRLADVSSRIAEGKSHRGPRGPRSAVKELTLALMRARKQAGQAFKEFLQEWQEAGELDGLELLRNKANDKYRVAVAASGEQSPELTFGGLRDWYTDCEAASLRGKRR